MERSRTYRDRPLSDFLDYLKIEKGLAELTVSAYHKDILQFAEFLGRSKRNLLTARREDVQGFIQQLFANSVDGRSVARKPTPYGLRSAVSAGIALVTPSTCTWMGICSSNR